MRKELFGNSLLYDVLKEFSLMLQKTAYYMWFSLDTSLLNMNLVCRYARHPALLGFELLNEPSAAAVPLDTLVSYYKQGYQIVRKHSESAYVIICQRIGNADPLELYQANIGSHNLVVDLHYYNLFDTFFVNMSSADNIQFIYKSRETQLQALNNANGPLVFIGMSRSTYISITTILVTNLNQGSK